MRAVIGWLLALSSILYGVADAHAGLELDATRLVYSAKQASAALKVRNVGALPVVVQAWVDDGNEALLPQQIKTPFTVTPPLQRIDAGCDRSLVVRVADAASLPSDREALFRLNIVEVPAEVPTAGARFQVSTHTRIKLLYRPDALQGAAARAAASLKWSAYRDGAGQYWLDVHNPTPYVVNVASLIARTTREKCELRQDHFPPFSHSRVKVGLTLRGSEPPPHIALQWIDDFGAVHPLQVTPVFKPQAGSHF